MCCSYCDNHSHWRIVALKKEFNWIQPATVVHSAGEPSLSFEQMLSTLQLIPQLEITAWKDVDRLDIRPNKGIIKVRARNRWEAQLDQVSGQVLKVAYRRSDTIEAIHDGTFFHARAKLGLFLPASILLLVLSLTGLYLFVQRILVRRRKRQRLQKRVAGIASH